VNYPGKIAGAPALSWDGARLYFYSTNRPDGFGGRDLYVATRERLRNDEAGEEEPVIDARLACGQF